MANEGKAIKIEPIGYVKNDFSEKIPEGYENLTSEIVVKKEYTTALYKIEENSHVVVLFWMDRIRKEGRKILKLHPKRKENLPLVGVFATRSPRRPNPIGIRSVLLLKRKKNVLKVKGLDALNNSPVLDIKPYSSKHDFVKDAKGPWWAKSLRSDR